jgi:hypothetical protein
VGQHAVDVQALSHSPYDGARMAADEKRCHAHMFGPSSKRQGWHKLVSAVPRLAGFCAAACVEPPPPD